MHSESEIRRAIKPLVELYGALNTSEVKDLLGSYLNYDAEDLARSKTRKEIMITQRIGNIVAHQSEDIKYYSEGYLVDKTRKPALFIAVTGTGARQAPLPAAEIEVRHARADKSEKKRRHAKLDWEKLNEERSALGVLGEEYVYWLERDKVAAFDPASVEKVIHLSASEGDGFGYDISSVDEAGETLYIEVKTTRGPEKTPFYMSLNEKNFFEDHVEKNAFLYRVYDFDEAARLGSVKMISAADLLAKYEFDPVSFRVKRK